MNKLIYLIYLSFYTQLLHGQNNTEQPKLQPFAGRVTQKFPATRMIDVEVQQVMSYDFTSKLLKEEYNKGTVSDRKNIKASFNAPILMKSNWAIIGSLRYQYGHFSVDNVTSESQSMPNIESHNDLHYFGGGASFAYSSTLFGKPAMYNISLIVDGSEKQIESWKATCSALLILKKTTTTTLSAGLSLNYDATALAPVIPILSWQQKLSRKWSLIAILPQRISLLNDTGKNGRISLSSELRTNQFYLYPEKEKYKDSYNYREILIQSGITYEHNFQPVIVYIKTGITQMINSKIVETGKKMSEHILSFNQNPAFFLSVGISLNP